MNTVPQMQIEVEREAGQGCRARFVSEEPVIADVYGNDRSRSVSTFNIEGHASSRQAFAWVAGGGLNRGEPEYIVVLSSDQIQSATQAVRSRARAAERRRADED